MVVCVYRAVRLTANGTGLLLGTGSCSALMRLAGAFVDSSTGTFKPVLGCAEFANCVAVGDGSDISAITCGVTVAVKDVRHYSALFTARTFVPVVGSILIRNVVIVSYGSCVSTLITACVTSVVKAMCFFGA